MKKVCILSALLVAVVLLTSGTIDLGHLYNYASQSIPPYITKDNTGSNIITDEGATLGRVLFYDKKMSFNNTTACGSCHKQQFAFSDTTFLSQGVNGLTARHSMRLVNARFSAERHFFWDERAESLEVQTTMPVRNHGEMGYSGANGDPDFSVLIAKLDTVSYYKTLFRLAFGDNVITEDRIQKALAQFVRSIQSFDAKYDVGRAQVNNPNAPFPNFTADENAGKALFTAAPLFDANGSRVGGGLGCDGCHKAPEFDIDPATLNNSLLLAAGQTGPNAALDTLVTKAPVLRDLINPQGIGVNFFHNGVASTFDAVLNHYNDLPPAPSPDLIPLIDPRLRPGGHFQKLNITQQERNQITAFIKTLTGSDVYVNEKWSDPFDSNGNLTLTGNTTSVANIEKPDASLNIYPNPASDYLYVNCSVVVSQIDIFNPEGKMIRSYKPNADKAKMDVNDLAKGIYFVRLMDRSAGTIAVKRIVIH